MYLLIFFSFHLDMNISIYIRAGVLLLAGYLIQLTINIHILFTQALCFSSTRRAQQKSLQKLQLFRR